MLILVRWLDLDSSEGFFHTCFYGISELFPDPKIMQSESALLFSFLIQWPSG